MAEEFEVKILSIDLDRVREVLAQIGMFVRRVAIEDEFFESDHTKASGSDVRLRQVAGQCTLAVKGPYRGKPGQKAREEVELPLSEMDVGRQALEMLGLSKCLERRLEKEYYTVGATSVEIVHNPLFPPYLEVEGTRADVIEVCEQMGFEDSEINVGGETYQRDAPPMA